MRIGDWIIRSKRGVAHVIESLVAGDAVTKCGRRLTDEPNTSGELVLFALGTRSICRVCLGTALVPLTPE